MFLLEIILWVHNWPLAHPFCQKLIYIYIFLYHINKKKRWPSGQFCGYIINFRQNLGFLGLFLVFLAKNTHFLLIFRVFLWVQNWPLLFSNLANWPLFLATLRYFRFTKYQKRQKMYQKHLLPTFGHFKSGQQINKFYLKYHSSNHLLVNSLTNSASVFEI